MTGQTPKTKFISAADTNAMKLEMRMYGHLNLVIEADTPVQAVEAKRACMMTGKVVNIINDFITPTDSETRDAVVKAFRAADRGKAVLIYVRPPSPSMKMIMEDHPEIAVEMDTMLSTPSDLM